MQKSLYVSRRHFFHLSAGTVLTAGLGCDSVKNILGIKKSIPVGLQLYSVRSECKKDFFKTIEAVAGLGYQGVEFAGYYEKTAKDIKKVLDDNGLVCCGTHTQYPAVQPELINQTIEFNLELGNKYLIIPWLGEELRGSKEDWKKTAAFFNKVAVKLQPHMLQIGYHNHGFEFQLMEGEMPWDIFAQNTNEDVILQLDTGNAAHGGVDPVPFLKKYPGRAVTVHIKEYSESNKNALIAEGDIRWQEVFEFCKNAGGTEWYIIEEEKDVLPPLTSVAVSLENFRKLQEARK